MTKPEKLSRTDPKEIHAQNLNLGLTKHISDHSAHVVLTKHMRGPAGPLPQVHPDKWYPSVETWAPREGRLGKPERTSGHWSANQCFLFQHYNWFSLFDLMVPLCPPSQSNESGDDQYSI